MMDVLKYIISPSGFIAVLLISGTLMLFCGRLRRPAIILVSIGVASYMILGSGPVSYWLIGSLEHRYPALHNIDGVKDISTIVVLAGHGEVDPYFPISSVVNPSTAFRLMEATRLSRSINNTRIIVSGPRGIPTLMKKVLISLGVPEHGVFVENNSRNTHESAVNVGAMIKTKDIILVTSAGHMPRSMGVFRKAGMKPVPAPTDFMVGTNPFAAGLLPTPSHMMYSDLAVHEYIGLLWYRVTDRL